MLADSFCTMGPGTRMVYRVGQASEFRISSPMVQHEGSKSDSDDGSFATAFMEALNLAGLVS
jgi:hypothetical protein